ncbi:MAG TPA: helix-turn-helix domain-containing protein [Gaiellaceae bacterium]|nr:helix-turn-helix domain-containing protein [Gaiellaceae bacterium]
MTADPTGSAPVGRRLRELRRQRGLTMAQLAEATGLTSGFLSQLERDLTSVSLSSLARICSVLDVRFGDVLDVAPTGEVIRRSEVPAWTGIGAHEDRLLSSRDERRFHLMESRIPPGAGAGEGLYTFPADVELAYVLAGRLELRVGETVHRVEAGDTLTYSPRDPHTWRNPSEDEDAVVLWFTVPNPFSPARERHRL